MSFKAVETYLVGPRYEDQRVDNWPLVANWHLPALIGLAYIVGIPIGQWIMRDRPAFKLKKFAAFHNACLFSLSLYMTIETWRQSSRNFGWSKNFKLWCNEVEAGSKFSESGHALARILYIHYLSKAYEFVDTFIMILKKNNRQVTFLHVYHHATTFFPVWWGVMRYGPGGEAWFCCFLNSAIHVLMYGYYFMASLGIRLGAKQLITISQMVQFLLFISQSIWHLFITDCSRPRLSSVFLLIQCIIFFTLFFNFYRKTYRKKKDSKIA